jgi:predicted nuclease of predicted toxin-antitoxin system
VSPPPEPIRLLFDENLSARLIAALADIYPGSAHVSELGLAGESDDAIWDHARQHGLAIVSKDEDFQRLSVLYGPPPKVIWVRLGNCSTSQIITLLRHRRSEIAAFLDEQDAAFLALA